MLQDEFEVIRSIAKIVGPPSRRVSVGIGDDAAVVRPPREKLVVTTDTLVENVHFDLTYMKPRELGHKAMAVNLSDLAAMAARPLYALVSLGLRQEISQYFVDEVYAGMKAIAKKYRVDIIGGNTVQSPTATIVDVVLLGEARRVTLRGSASAGDVICLTGAVGDSAAGLSLLKRLGRSQVPAGMERLVRAHLTPQPRVDEALLLGRYVTAAIDLSDGLSVDLHHLVEASKVGAVIDSKRLPISKSCRKAAEFLGSSAKKWALCGGEDYELVVTLAPEHLGVSQRRLKKLGGRLYPIGEITCNRGIQILDENSQSAELRPLGWNHFVRRVKLRRDPQ